jgi:tetratricopeptide (TPR) repeat protein
VTGRAATTGAATYTLRRVQALLGLSRRVIDGLIAEGFVKPTRGPRNERRFDFQDLLLLRAAHALRAAGIPPRRILRSLAELRARLPAELPLAGLRITAVGNQIAVRDRSGQWQADSGQLLMDFEVIGPAGGDVDFLPRQAPAADPAGAEAAFERGIALEARDPQAAEAAYREALGREPAFEPAYLNLGALLAEGRRFAELLALSDEALARCEGSALLHFNRAIALDHLERLADAAASYERALALDPALADAHYNLGRVREQLGDARGALRHFNAYRRLQR